MNSLVLALVVLMGLWDEGKPIPKGSLVPIPAPRPLKFQSYSSKSRIFFEDFESGGSGWSITNGVWQIGNPTYGPDSAHSGVNCAGTVLDGNYPDYADSRLISPYIILPSLNQPEEHINLSFWHWFEIESGYDYGVVEVSTDGGASWTELMSFSGNGTSWRQHSVRLDAYAGQTIQIAFRFYSDYSVTYAGWYVDDIEVMKVEPQPVDVEISNISTGLFPFVFLTVRADTWGAPIYSLDENNFQVFENGLLQTDYFDVTPPDTSGGVRVVDIVFCMDNSGSMEDEITGVSQHVSDFVSQLQQSGYDFALGLVRFGGWENNGYPIVEDNGMLTSDIDYFINDLWTRNYADGGFEPGWDAMVAAATQMHWRPGTQRIIILITDESPTGDNNFGYYTYDQTLDILQQNNSTVFAMIDPTESPPCVQDYGTIAEATGGAWFDIQSPMDSLLNAIGGAITSTYVIRYRASDTLFTGTREVVVRLSYRGNSDEDTTYYIAGSTPIIILTDSTQNLINNLTLVQGQEVRITTYVVDHVPPGIRYVRLYYRHHGEPTYQSMDMVNEHDSLFAAVIPSTIVDTPGIEFYFEASDSLSTVTLPSTNPSTNPFVVAVWPNYAPFIFHIPSNSSEINALVFDNTNNIEHVWLFFRELGTIVWDSVEMTLIQSGTVSNLAPQLGVAPQEIIDSANARGLPLTSSHTASLYNGIITCDLTNGAEYYLKAVDNWGIAGFSGLPDAPHIIPPSGVDFEYYCSLKTALIDSFINAEIYESQEHQISSFVEQVRNLHNQGNSTPQDEEAVARLALSEKVGWRMFFYADSVINIIAPCYWELVPENLIETLLGRLANLLSRYVNIPFIGSGIRWFVNRINDALSIFGHLRAFFINETNRRLSNLLLEHGLEDPYARDQIIQLADEYIFDPLLDSLESFADSILPNVSVPTPEEIMENVVIFITSQGNKFVYQWRTEDNFDSMYVWATTGNFNVGQFGSAESNVTNGVLPSVEQLGNGSVETTSNLRNLFGLGDWIPTILNVLTLLVLIAAVIAALLSCGVTAGIGCILGAISGFSGWAVLQSIERGLQGAQTLARISAIAAGEVSLIWSMPEMVQEGTFVAFDKQPPAERLQHYHEIYEKFEPLALDWNDSLELVQNRVNQLVDSARTLITLGETDSLDALSDELSHALNDYMRISNLIGAQISVGSNFAILVDSTFDSLYTFPSLGSLYESQFSLGISMISFSFAAYSRLSSSQLDTFNWIIDRTLLRSDSATVLTRQAISRMNQLGVQVPPIIVVEQVQITRASPTSREFTVTAGLRNISSSHTVHNVVVSLNGIGQAISAHITPLSDTLIPEIRPQGRSTVSWNVSVENTSLRRASFRILPLPLVQDTIPLPFEGLSRTFSVSFGITAPSNIRPLSNKNILIYPNPFNPSVEQVKIAYMLSNSGEVTIKIYDSGMNPVRTIIENEHQVPGHTYIFTWDGKNDRDELVANGVYFCVVESSSGERGVAKIAVKK